MQVFFPVKKIKEEGKNPTVRDGKLELVLSLKEKGECPFWPGNCYNFYL